MFLIISVYDKCLSKEKNGSLTKQASREKERERLATNRCKLKADRINQNLQLVSRVAAMKRS